MKKIILGLLLLWNAIVLIAGELVPLQQYSSSRQTLSRVPDHVLFRAIGILTALDFSQTDDETFLSKFNKVLSVEDQYCVAHTLLIDLYDDERMKNFFIPAYNIIRYRANKEFFDDSLRKRFVTIWHNFLDNFTDDPDKINEFYNYVRRRVTSSYKDDISDDEQFYIATMLRFTSAHKLRYAEGGEKDDIINFIVEAINKTKSNAAKTQLTCKFFQVMDKDQLEKLNTTEYALLLAWETALYCGKYLDYAEIYYNLFQRQKEYISSKKIITDKEFMDGFHRYFPKETWKSPLEAFEFIYKNRDSFVFDKKNRTYIRK